MSEHDDTLLDEDLGDEEYDLGNDEEEALLADDYEVERQSSYKGEEETDDVLDLGVTDALDDLEGDEENIEFNRNKTDNRNDGINDFSHDEQPNSESIYYEHDERLDHHCYEDGYADSINQHRGKGDLREKLQKNLQKAYMGNGQGLEDDDCEEARERRNRFQNERTMISSKMNHEIPDSLENVVTSESLRGHASSFLHRGRGRGRIGRGARGGRPNVPNSTNYNPRFVNACGSFDNQDPPQFRPLPPVENRFIGGPLNNIQQQQIIFQQQNMQQMPPFQQSSNFSNNGLLLAPGHFPENRPPFNPSQSQFHGSIGPIRTIGPRMEHFGSRPGLPGPGPGASPYGPPNQQVFMQPPALFQRPPGIGGGPVNMPQSLPRHMQGNPVPNSILTHNSNSLLPNPNQHPGNSSGQILPGMSMQGFPHRQQVPLPPPGPHMSQISGPVFENRPPSSHFQEPVFPGRPPYERPNYTDQPNNQFNNNLPPPQPLPNQQLLSGSNPTIPLSQGHKILINPHFRGNVQAGGNDGPKFLWESQQQASGEFSQNTNSYQNQSSYSQSQSHGKDNQYQQSYQSTKSDDPYAYFSDVWQENKSQKSPGLSPSKQYIDNTYRDGTFANTAKYRADEKWNQKDNFPDEHRSSQKSYHERELASRTRNYDQKPRISDNNYDSYDQNRGQRIGRLGNSESVKTLNKVPQKRPTNIDKNRELSPKRLKNNSKNLQEVKTTEINNEEDAEDPEMQEYRKKMEEQKRLREQILKEKENRRKMAALKQNDEQNESSASETVTNVVKSILGPTGMKETSKFNPECKVRGRVVGPQTTETPERTPGVRIIRPIQTIQVNEPGARRIVIQKSENQETSSQKQTAGQEQSVSLKKSTISGQKVNNVQRVVIQKSLGGMMKAASSDISTPNTQKVLLNTQNNQRVVLQSSNTKKSDMKTNTVKIENLAARTSEAQIRRMCNGIGMIENIQMGEGCATIVFKTQSAAMVFHKKYQRKMLDLSLITVRLLPQTNKKLNPT
ncbi:RNA-binding protein 33-like [Prorops nasuta]|uniref:RNA-binding protein 33-like n=1 Tax=Prorops nasuta TaxID=863751 RepID=UPI0034CE4C2E